ncbi:tRNA lysidine(34) synthetase TilS [Phenylobacterium sp. VNQ135]|uniref:tRNA lysidine(34) synthetase TilS n=1 Tax=Phenylobacterium sp. VNQ135 TaxID=3400922 RepID=UPI003C0AA32A
MRGLGLQGLETASLRDLGDAAREVMDRRLRPKGGRPIVVAFSGGGDSLALLLIAQVWAARTRRPLMALTVDHGLSAESERWVDACARAAGRLDVGFRALVWEGAKPAVGLPAAARAARHKLLAEAARQLGARVILMGHTADDVLEARLMREAGASTPTPFEWAPSPAWPDGRGLFLLRPLLTARRAAIRTWLARRGESWIDDPANADARFARPRVRALAASRAAEPQSQPPALALAETAVEEAGAFSIPAAALRAASRAEVERLLALTCVCAGGRSRLPTAARVRALADRVMGDAASVATLAGARVEVSADRVLICREPGEAARGGLGAQPLPPGAPIVWDGRFQLKAISEGLAVRRLAGLSRRLPPAQQAALLALPPAVRAGLPVIVAPDGGVACPVLEEVPGVKIKPLVRKRLRAAAGLVSREPD